MNTFSMVVLMGLVCYLFSKEMRAAISAVMAVRAQPTGILRKTRFAWLHYLYASVVWHEGFASLAGRKPSYSVANAFLLFAGMFFGLGLGSVAMNIELDSAIPAQMAMFTSLGYFAVKYGRSFMAERSRVEATISEFQGRLA